MEDLCMNELNRPHSKFNLAKSNFGADTLFYYNNLVVGKELPAGDGVELVLMKTTDKIYDSIESNGFLFSEETNAINEDEYAIISDSDCDCYGDSFEEKLTNEVGSVAVLLQNGDHCKRNGDYEQRSKTEHCNVEEINKTENVGKQVRPEPNTHRNQASKQSIVSVQFNSQGMNGNCSRKASKLHVDDMNKISTIVSNARRENDDDEDIEEMYSFENTSTPNKDYEMKILAGRSEVSEVFLQVRRKIEHCNERSLEEEDEEEERKPNSFKLQDLTSRIRKSREDQKEMEYFRRSSQEELHIPNNKSCGDRKKEPPVPRRPFAIPTIDIKNASPIIVNSNKKQISSKESTINTEKWKNGTRSSNSSPDKFDLDMTCIQHHTATTTYRPRGKTKITRVINENENDESFFEIDDRYGEYNHDGGIRPIELEMKTISSDTTGDITDGLNRTADFMNEGLNRTTAFMTDGLNTTTEPNSPHTSVEVLKGCAVSCRYISIYKQEQRQLCKCISIAFINIKQPRKMLNYKLDVPCEEIIEDVYTHLIEEMIIYDDEKTDEYEDPYSICDDEWHIIR